jgi:hypothetical protein
VICNVELVGAVPLPSTCALSFDWLALCVHQQQSSAAYHLFSKPLNVGWLLQSCTLLVPPGATRYELFIQALHMVHFPETSVPNVSGIF